MRASVGSGGGQATPRCNRFTSSNPASAGSVRLSAISSWLRTWMAVSLDPHSRSTV